MQHHKFIFFLLCGLFFYQPPALAAAITNLSDHPQVFAIDEGGGFREVSIPAGQTYRTYGKWFVRFHDRDVRMEDNEEFAYWQNGDFGPQYRRRNNTTLNSQ